MNTDAIHFCHIYIRSCNIVFPSLPLSYKKLDGYFKDDVQYGFLLVLNYVSALIKQFTSRFFIAYTRACAVGCVSSTATSNGEHLPCRWHCQSPRPLHHTLSSTLPSALSLQLTTVDWAKSESIMWKIAPFWVDSAHVYKLWNICQPFMTYFQKIYLKPIMEH